MSETSTAQVFQLALQHHQANRLQQAEELYRQILQREPQNSFALGLLGMLYGQTGRYAPAIDLLCKSIATVPDPRAFRAHLGQCYAHLGHALLATGQFDQAAEALRQALNIDPGNMQARVKLGSIFASRGNRQQAAEHFQAAVSALPRDVAACISLGNLLAELGALDHAIQCHRKAIEIDPTRPEAHHNLGVMLQRRMQLGEAAAAYSRAIELRPDYPEASNNLGIVLFHAGRLEEAEACFRRLIGQHPDYAEARNNLSAILGSQWRLDEAIEQLRQAIAARPDYAQAHSNLLLDLQHVADYSPDLLFAEHQRWAAQHAAGPMKRIRLHANVRDPSRRLRVGYLSSDFRHHSIAFFVEPILANHDRGQFEVFCYPSVRQPDAVTQRLRGLANQWRDVSLLTDEQIADLVRADAIDVLIDLAGHIADTRLLALAYKPAPVQLTYLGYQGTSGLPTVDYRLTDAWCDPPGMTERYHSEQLARLPQTFACYAPPPAAPDVAPLPALARGHVTFGSFSKIEKISERVLRLWAAVLRQVTGSRLLIVGHGIQAPSAHRRLLAALESEGVSADRVEFSGSSPFADYLQKHNQVDLILDTFPFCGHTTTCHALWMGVPIVTLVGQSYPARKGLSVLTNLGLQELAANTADEFVSVASRLAQDLPRLAELRIGMRQRMRQSPMMDAARFTKDLEALVRGMWQRWCAG